MSYRHIEEKILRSIWEINHNDAIIEELIDLYRSGVKDFFEKLTDAIIREDYRQVPFLIHRLKGSSANIGAVRITNEMKILENSLIERRGRSNFAWLQQECDQLSDVFTKTFSELDRLHKEFQKQKCC